jgi:hypothetical protein
MSLSNRVFRDEPPAFGHAFAREARAAFSNRRTRQGIHAESMGYEAAWLCGRDRTTLVPGTLMRGRLETRGSSGGDQEGARHDCLSVIPGK